MKPTYLPFVAALLLLYPLPAEEDPHLEIALYPGIRVAGTVGATYVIESRNEGNDPFWLTRGWVELSTPSAVWIDPVPARAPQRIYRAVQVNQPAVQTVANMIWIPPGRFVMGSPNDERGRLVGEGPQTQVILTKSFWLGKYEVTQREYQTVMGTNPSCVPGDPERPVECVWWEDAVAFCQKLTEHERGAGRLPPGWTYALPTEAQWEYACRAGTTTRFSFGDALDCDDQCSPCALRNAYVWWCGDKDPPGPKRVGQKLPNAWGFHDMHGNVWEWCADWWSGSLPGGSVTDPTGPASGTHRVHRGGHWEHPAHRCRSAVRFYFHPGSWLDRRGFRLALVPTP